MTPDTFERIVWTGMAAAMAFALSEQCRKGLIRAYPWFATWLAISLASFAGLVWLPMDGRPYRIAWAATEALRCIAACGVLWRIYRRTCDCWPVPRRWSYWQGWGGASVVMLVTAIALQAPTLRLDWPDWDRWVGRVIWARRLEMAATTAFLALLLLFGAWLRRNRTGADPRGRNLVLHTRSYLVISAAMTLHYWLIGYLDGAVAIRYALDCVWMAVLAGVFIWWGCAMTAGGECGTVMPPPEIDWRAVSGYRGRFRWRKTLDGGSEMRIDLVR